MIKGIDKIYCINLDRRTDRWEKMVPQFKEHDINVERFSGIDGRLLTNSKSYGASVLGFNTSQIRVLENSILEGHEVVMVIEDDAVLHPEFVKILEEGIAELPESWRLCYLGGSNVKNSEKFSNRLAVCAETLSTVGYLIKTSFARDELLPVARRNYTSVEFDATLAMLQKQFAMHIFEPRLVYQREDYSDIQHSVVNYAHQRDF